MFEFVYHTFTYEKENNYNNNNNLICVWLVTSIQMNSCDNLIIAAKLDGRCGKAALLDLDLR